MIAVEIRKQVWRLRTYVGLGLLAVIPIIFTVAYKVNPPTGGRLGFFDLTGSGLNVPIVALGGVSAFLLTVVASLFAGETVSGEASWGTLSYLLVRPVSRNRVLRSKLAVAAGADPRRSLRGPARRTCGGNSCVWLASGHYSCSYTGLAGKRPRSPRTVDSVCCVASSGLSCVRVHVVDHDRLCLWRRGWRRGTRRRLPDPQ